MLYNILRRRVADGYTYLSYIQTTGSQYIDTGIVNSQFYLVALDASIDSFSNGDSNVCLFGYYNETSNSISMCATENSIIANYGTAQTIFTQDFYGAQPINIILDTKYQFLAISNRFIFDNKLLGSVGKTFSGDDLTITLFGRHTNSGVDRFVKGKIYDCQIAINTNEKYTLVRDFKPVRRNIDNTLGLYDEVNNKFYILQEKVS